MLPAELRFSIWEMATKRFIADVQSAHQDQANNPHFYKAMLDVEQGIRELESIIRNCKGCDYREEFS